MARALRAQPSLKLLRRGRLRGPVALAFQMRAVPKSCLRDRIRNLTDAEIGELELATDEALGRVEPQD